MKARILVIEDEMSINDLLCMNLEIAGYETVGLSLIHIYACATQTFCQNPALWASMFPQQTQKAHFMPKSPRTVSYTHLT